MSLGVFINVCTLHESSTHKNQGRAADPLELELWKVVNYYVGTGIRTPVLYKNSECS